MKLQANIYIGDILIRITGVPEKECIIEMSGPVTSNELSAIHCIAETVRCLKNNKPIDYHFNPMITEEDQSKFYKCEWMRSGRLIIRDANPSRMWQHATTRSQAISRTRVFTCPVSIYKQLPARKITDGETR